MNNRNKVFGNTDDFLQTVSNKNNSLQYKVNLESIRKYVRKNYNVCDNHNTISHLINKIENALITYFDSLTDGLFDDLIFETLLKHLGTDENKEVIAKHVDDLHIYNTTHTLKSLYRSFN